MRMGRDIVRLRELYWKTGVDEIGAYAFGNLDELIDVTLPSSIKSVGIQVFWGCVKLQQVNMPEHWECGELSSAMFFNCRNLYSVRIPSGVKTIGECCFVSCPLRDVVFVDKTQIVEIGNWSFSDAKQNDLGTDVTNFINDINPRAFEKKAYGGYSSYEIVYTEQV